MGSGRVFSACRTIFFSGLWLLAVAAALGTPASGRPAAGARAATTLPVATASRNVFLKEKARLRFYAERGDELLERGYAYGTYNAPIEAGLIIHSKSVTATVSIFPRGGSIRASADANYKIVKNLGYFGGTLKLGHGSGRYRRVTEAHHTPLGISGIINRYNFEMEVKANGEVTGV